MKEKKIILFNINVHRNHSPAEVVEVEEVKPIPNEFAVRTDFRRQQYLLRKKKNTFLSLNAPSQVHEFVIHYLLHHHNNILGINFIVKDSLRSIIIIQIQINWWDRQFRKKKWQRICHEMSKMVSEKMPIGICTIKPV